MPDFRVRLKVNPKTRKKVFAADVHSVFDICWYTLARKMSEDVAPEDKGTSADKKEKPAGVVMSCPFCGEAFVRRSNRSVICGKPECEKARKAMNQRNSPVTAKHIKTRILQQWRILVFTFFPHNGGRSGKNTIDILEIGSIIIFS